MISCTFEKQRYSNPIIVGPMGLQVRKLKETLPLLDKNYAAQDEKDTCMALSNTLYCLILMN